MQPATPRPLTAARSSTSAKRPRLQLCPPGFTCHRPGCVSPAIVADASDRDETYCADHALDSFDIDELYAVTKDSDAAAEISAFLAADRQDRADFERESREGGIGR